MCMQLPAMAARTQLPLVLPRTAPIMHLRNRITSRTAFMRRASHKPCRRWFGS